MDLLDSIISKMAKPPSIDDKQKKLMKEHQKALDAARNKEREHLCMFRKNMEQRVHQFILDEHNEKLRLEPMDQVARSVVRDVADVAGLTTYTFGMEGEDRHVMLFKKDYPLDERELQAYRNGEEWDLAEADRLTAQLQEAQREDEFRQHLQQQQRRQQQRQQRHYKQGGITPDDPKFIEKIDRLVGGRQTGKQAARSITVDNDRTFGFVRSELKKDKRTIEQTLADIKAKKQRRDVNTSGSDLTSSRCPDEDGPTVSSRGPRLNASSDDMSSSSSNSTLVLPVCTQHHAGGAPQ